MERKNKQDTLEGTQGDFPQAPWHGSLQLPFLSFFGCAERLAGSQLPKWELNLRRDSQFSQGLSPGPRGTLPCSFRTCRRRPLPPGMAAQV